MKKKLAASDGLMSISGDELDENTDALSSTTTQSCAPSKRKARKETDDALLAGIEERGKNMMAFQQKMLEHLKPSSSDHERDAFVDWIRTVVNELEHNLWRRCQQDINSTLYRYIGENDSQTTAVSGCYRSTYTVSTPTTIPTPSGFFSVCMQLHFMAATTVSMANTAYLKCVTLAISRSELVISAIDTVKTANLDTITAHSSCVSWIVNDRGLGWYSQNDNSIGIGFSYYTR